MEKEIFVKFLQDKEMPVADFMEHCKIKKEGDDESPRITGFHETCDDEIGACLAVYTEREKRFGMVCLLQASKLIVQAEQDEIDQVLENLEILGEEV